MILWARIKNGLLALAASLVYVFRLRQKGAPRRILVIQNAKMGDMVCTTPLFRALKEHYGDAEVVVMGTKLNGDLLAGNPRVDRYLVRPGGLAAFIKVLSEERLDTVLLSGPDVDALLASLFARIPRIILPRIENGWSPYETSAYRLLSRFAEKVPHRMGSYAPREYLRLLEPLGIRTDDTRKEVFVAEEAVSRVKELLRTSGHKGGKLVGIAPGVGNKAKVWGGERFAKVAEALAKRGAEIVIVGGLGDRAEVAVMRAALPPSFPLIDLCEKLSLEELKALIQELALFVSVDTGPVYIAEALGTPTVDIVGPMDENEQPPRGERHRVVVPEREKPMLRIMNASVFDWDEARRQAEAITPEMVIREAEALLGV